MELPEEVRLFLVEAYENLDQVEVDLVELEKTPGDSEKLNSIFRSIHTIKGNSGFLAFPTLEAVCHTAETLLDKLRSGQLELTQDMTTVLLEFMDTVRKILENIENTAAEGQVEIDSVKARLA